MIGTKPRPDPERDELARAVGTAYSHIKRAKIALEPLPPGYLPDAREHLLLAQRDLLVETHRLRMRAGPP